MMMACLLLDEDDVNKETMNMSIPSNPRAEEDVELPSGLKVESHSPGGLKVDERSGLAYSSCHNDPELLTKDPDALPAAISDDLVLMTKDPDAFPAATSDDPVVFLAASEHIGSTLVPF